MTELVLQYFDLIPQTLPMTQAAQRNTLALRIAGCSEEYGVALSITGAAPAAVIAIYKTFNGLAASGLAAGMNVPGEAMFSSLRCDFSSSMAMLLLPEVLIHDALNIFMPASGLAAGMDVPGEPTFSYLQCGCKVSQKSVSSAHLRQHVAAGMNVPEDAMIRPLQACTAH